MFGPSAAAARLEGSKSFTKDLCRANGIPTAAYVRAETAAEAHAALDRFGIPVVIKVDELAAGKGVTVAMTRAEAGQRSTRRPTAPLVIEEFLDGEEASLFALVDGGRGAAGIGAGSQARRRGRHRPEHRRHGRLCAGAGADAGAAAARDGRDRRSDRAGAGRGRNPVQRRALCRADADRRRTQADRI